MEIWWPIRLEREREEANIQVPRLPAKCETCALSIGKGSSKKIKFFSYTKATKKRCFFCGFPKLFSYSLLITSYLSHNFLVIIFSWFRQAIMHVRAGTRFTLLLQGPHDKSVQKEFLSHTIKMKLSAWFFFTFIGLKENNV